MNQTIPVGGPAALSWLDAVSLFEQVLGRPIQVNHVQPGQPLPGLPPFMAELMAGFGRYEFDRPDGRDRPALRGATDIAERVRAGSVKSNLNHGGHTMAAISPQDRYVRVGSINTRYRIQGAGSPVVLIHGIGSSLEDWDLNFAPLAEQHCVWALDLVGNGRSDKPAAPYTMAYFSNFVRDFSAQGLDRVSLVGSSLGGTVTLDFAIRYPEFQTGIDSGWGRLPSPRHALRPVNYEKSPQFAAHSDKNYDIIGKGRWGFRPDCL